MITAVGGGTAVIPFLTVYAVLPLSVVFLVAFSFGSQRFSRARLFYIIITTFLAFFVTFAYLYPHHQVRVLAYNSAHTSLPASQASWPMVQLA